MNELKKGNLGFIAWVMFILSTIQNEFFLKRLTQKRARREFYLEKLRREQANRKKLTESMRLLGITYEDL